MARFFRKFRILVYKNLLMRKSHWIADLANLCIIPVFLAATLTFSSYWVIFLSKLSLPPSKVEIFYSPNSIDAQQIMEGLVQNCDNSVENLQFHLRKSQLYAAKTITEAMDLYKKSLTAQAFVVELQQSKKSLNYTIWIDGQIKDYYNVEIDVSFAKLQYCLDLEIIRKTDESFSPPKLTTPHDPSENFLFNTLVNVGSYIFPSIFLLPVARESVEFTSEKCSGIYVLLAMNGVSIFLNLLSWYISAILGSFLYTIPMTLIFKLSSVFLYSNGFILFVMSFVMAAHTLSFGYFYSSLIATPLAVKHTFSLVHFLLPMALSYFFPNIQPLVPYFGPFLPVLLQKTTFDEVMNYEIDGKGINWWNLFKSSKYHTSAAHSAGISIILSIVGAIFYILLTTYVQNVRPGKYGTAKHPLFFLNILKRKRQSEDIDMNDLKYDHPMKNLFEAEPRNSVPGVQIRNLKKTYPGGFLKGDSFQALHGVSLNFYKNTITSLLGHNGAGKTTMLSILTGMTSATEGKILVNGKDTKSQMDEVHADIGFCPQDDLFFPDLTVFQQLLIIAMLKRDKDSKDQITKDIDDLLRTFNITEKRNTLPEKISGGQKRRLCLSMALIGNASTLILDEPTSGMDPEIRRETWDIILGLRSGKTIVITTHDMDEADVLGDRIIIMHHGTLRCDATAMYLKNYFGQGNMEISMSTEDGCDPQEILKALDSNCEIKSHNRCRLQVQVPITNNLPDALDYIDSQKDRLGITGMSVSLMSLEQIFLKLAKDKNESGRKKSVSWSNALAKVDGMVPFRKQFSAIVAKKFTYTWKSTMNLLIMILLPLLGIALASIISSTTTNNSTTKISPNSIYSKPQFLISQYPNPSFYQDLKKSCEFQGASCTNVIGDEEILAELAFTNTEELLHINITKQRRKTLALPLAVNIIGNFLMKRAQINESYSIDTYVSHLPEKEGIKVQSLMTSLVNVDTIYAMIIVHICFFFLIPVLKEAISGVKHLQLMTGVSPITYWISTFFFDFAFFTLLSIICTSAMAIFWNYNFNAILLTLIADILFGINILPVMYLLSLWKKSTKFNQNLYSTFALLYPYAYAALWKFQYLDPYNALCRIEPITSFFVMTMKIYRMNASKLLDQSFFSCLTFSMDPSYFTLGQDFMILCATSVALICALMILEYRKKIFAKKQVDVISAEHKDNMVDRERQLVKSEIDLVRNASKAVVKDDVESGSSNSESMFLAYELRKQYGNVKSVQGVSFHVEKRECFGLLGVNGAGKTTTFKMLTGEVTPNSGLLCVNGVNSQVNRTKYLSEMGYCPQFSAIIKSLNAEDHLRLFARLKGFSGADVENEVQNWITRLNLSACASRPSGTYSGGNKRRLSIAIAMMANPNLVLLDEPTTGVDPSARRSLWSVINAAQDHGQSIILTSHSMEECEVLCNRLAIMVNGELKCIGSSQELTRLHLVGFNIIVRLKQGSSSHEIENVKTHMTTELPCSLVDSNSSILTYNFQDNQSWRSVYDAMNTVKMENKCVEDFVVTSGTLEQVFMKFAQAAVTENVHESVKIFVNEEK